MPLYQGEICRVKGSQIYVERALEDALSDKRQYSGYIRRGAP